MGTKAQKLSYKVLPQWVKGRARAGDASSLRTLQKLVSQSWRGQDAVSEVRSQREK